MSQSQNQSDYKDKGGKKYLLIMEDINLTHPEGLKGAVFEVDPKTKKVLNPKKADYEYLASPTDGASDVWQTLHRWVDNPR
jgi:hypothetical protein